MFNFCSIGKPNKVKELNYTIISPDKIKISWYTNSLRCVIQKTIISGIKDTDDVYNVVNASTCEVQVNTDCKYKFTITALSDFGCLESEPASVIFPNER